jgi:chemotaxis regulatin CheY-phosphate phosphatase CheZ
MMLKNFVEMVRGLVPLLESVKFSIEESSNRIPKASSQLSKVSEATESATVEILNVLEKMSDKILRAQGELKILRGLIVQTEDTEKALVAADKWLSETNDDSMTIAMALQVQDITSQQLAGVVHIIESVRAQLSEALERFESGEESDMPAARKEAKVQKPFDIDASFSKSPDRQNAADEIVDQWLKGK